MLATGGSAAAIRFIKEKGGATSLMVLIAAPEGIAAVQAAHPDVEVFTAAIDEKLIPEDTVPGLGDAETACLAPSRSRGIVYARAGGALADQYFMEIAHLVAKRSTRLEGK